MTISSALFSERMLARFSDMNEAIQLRQTKISTGQAINEASDAPIDAVRLSALGEVTSRVERYTTNLTVAQRRLSLGDDTLSSADNLYTRLREVQLSAASDTISASDRASIKLEIDGINEQVLALANTTDTAGQALFGGYATDLEPFVKNADGSVSYMGDAGDHTLAAGDALRLPTSINGGDAFMRVETGDGVHSVFDLMSSFSNALDASREFTTSASTNAQGSVNLDLVADRRPQNWTLDITGPKGTATVSFVAVDGSSGAARDAINAAQAATGVTAAINAADGRSLELSTNIATGNETIAVTNLKIEGRELAEYPPSYYAKVKPSDAGRAVLLTSMRAQAPVPDVTGVPFTAPSGVTTSKFSLEGKEYTLTYTPSGSLSAKGTVVVSTSDGEDNFITATVTNANNQDTITLSVAGGTLSGIGPVPLNNNEAVLLGLSSASNDTAGVPQNTVKGRTFTALAAGQSREMNVNLNGKTITVTHSKESTSPFDETVTTNETFSTSNLTGVTPGTGSNANVWTAVANSMELTIEGVALTATGTDPASRAANLAIAINGNAELAAKGITARASTDADNLGKLHVGTLAVKATNATDPAAYGDGSVPLATTQFTLSSDLLIGTPAVVSSASATSMGFNVSQTPLSDSAEVSVIPVSQGLAAHKEHMNAISESVAVHKTVVGSRLRRANDQEAVLAQRALVLAQEVSDLSSANIENLITELTSLMTSQKAARQAYSMVSQSSLFDFVK
ncbi:MAG: flagellar hook-associated protein FlgL [Paracoccaceae bacterium]|nr:flagellar hook-associated protein FlgL [Paracoccaceae bacterium]